MRKGNDFSKKVKETLAKRVGMHCSNPNCNQLTCGPQKDPEKTLNIGVAAHITGAAKGAARYDESLTEKQRASIGNGIWLCQNCAKLIDNDAVRYPVSLIRQWKSMAEEKARLRVDGKKAKSKKHRADFFDEQSPLEKILCPTCKKEFETRIGKGRGSMVTLNCNTCGRFHVHRELDGTLFVRKWNEGAKSAFVTCPKCSHQIKFRGDRLALLKPCLDCESIIRIYHGSASYEGPMNAQTAASYSKMGWQHLLRCPNCGDVDGITFGVNSEKIIFAKCPKCLTYLKFQDPAEYPTTH